MRKSTETNTRSIHRIAMHYRIGAGRPSLGMASKSARSGHMSDRGGSDQSLTDDCMIENSTLHASESIQKIEDSIKCMMSSQNSSLYDSGSLNPLQGRFARRMHQ